MNIKQVRAQSAGVVLEVIAAEGTRVEIGEELLMCETMKMEIPVEAPCSGIVGKVLVSVGQIVQENDPLVELIV